MKKGLLLVLLWCLIVPPVMAQRRTVSGLVTEESSGEPLPGASVMDAKQRSVELKPDGNLHRNN